MKTILLIISLFSICVSAEEKNKVDPTKKEIPLEKNFVVMRKRSSPIGLIEMTCQEKDASPEKEITHSFKISAGKKTKLANSFFQTKNYNSCLNYKFTLGKDLLLKMVSGPGKRINEAGATVTTTFKWSAAEKNFKQISQVIYSPFKEVETQYLKALKEESLEAAEKIIIEQRSKIDAAIESELTNEHFICDRFQKAYELKGARLNKEQKFKEAFQHYFTMQHKFADPQNIFYDEKAKKNNLVIVCQNSNADNDQSEDQFYAFSRKYLNRIDYVPYLILQAHRKVYSLRGEPKDEAESILKFTSQLMKTGSIQFQLDHEIRLIEAWNKIIKNNPEHNQYARMIDEDIHLLFILAKKNKCKMIPKYILKRAPMRDDTKESLEAMTLTAANDYFKDGLDKSGIYEYKQFVQARAILNRCDEIPKIVFDRYFKFVKTHSFDN